MLFAIVIFTIAQWCMIIGLLIFIPNPENKKDKGNGGGLGIDIDQIILPPVDGVTYPSQPFILENV